MHEMKSIDSDKVREDIHQYQELYSQLCAGEVNLREYFKRKADIFRERYEKSKLTDTIVGLKGIIEDAINGNLIFWSQSKIHQELDHENSHTLAAIAYAKMNGLSLDVHYGFLLMSDLFASRTAVLFTNFPNEKSQFSQPEKYIDFNNYILQNSGRVCDFKLYGYRT